eukprot:snap_masked-scaffold_26-processed-gene-4.93-mRNA-1 protein AED:1.00 eAED:1.00 QI:0/0/0/0/1/1/3/0/68
MTALICINFRRNHEKLSEFSALSSASTAYPRFSSLIVAVLKDSTFWHQVSPIGLSSCFLSQFSVVFYQ